MNNPNLPNRPVWHAPTLQDAGFELDDMWMSLERDYPSSTDGNETDAAKLIYWIRDGVRICLFDYETITLKDLIKRIESEAECLVKRKMREGTIHETPQFPK